MVSLEKTDLFLLSAKIIAMDFDVITIGTATRDAFVEVKNLKKILANFLTGESLCLPLGEK